MVSIENLREYSKTKDSKGNYEIDRIYSIMDMLYRKYYYPNKDPKEAMELFKVFVCDDKNIKEIRDFMNKAYISDYKEFKSLN